MLNGEADEKGNQMSYMHIHNAPRTEITWSALDTLSPINLYLCCFVQQRQAKYGSNNGTEIMATIKTTITVVTMVVIMGIPRYSVSINSLMMVMMMMIIIITIIIIQLIY